MESTQDKNENANQTRDDIATQIEEIKEEIKKKGINPVEYIEKELSGLKLNPDQKEILKDCINE
jgi:DNA invertase Pin-like site-specific DNA recombinase